MFSISPAPSSVRFAESVLIPPVTPALNASVPPTTYVPAVSVFVPGL